jgi:two-component system, OmpR family, KDP operon response regulator KdpE
MPTVLAVDDDATILRTLRKVMTAHGYDVRVADSGEAAVAAATARPPDVILLDLGLPDLDGVEVIGRIRAGSAAPIIVLSGRLTAEQKVQALDAGADDYLTKPFDVHELLARVRAIARREEGRARSRVTIGDYEVDVSDHRVSPRPDPAGSATKRTDGTRRDVRLTRTEWLLLETMVSHPGRLLTPPELLTSIHAPRNASSSYLRQYMTQLRHKLEPDPAHPRFLVTELGVGYRFAPAD